jgi:hypothetical protein
VDIIAQTLHRLTSYEPGREWTDPVDDPHIVQDLEVNDLDRLPWFHKRYPSSLPRTSLPADLPPTTAPTLSVLAGAVVEPLELDLAQLGRLLHLASGVVRTMERPYGTWLFRAAGSAGGRFPLELYVAVPSGTALPPGVHWYDPSAHALVTIGPPPTGPSPAIITTGIPWRTGWRYRERGYRHVYWDAGTMLSQLLTAAASAGLPADLYTSFPDQTVAALVGADGVHEWPVAVVALGGSPALTPSGPASAGQVDAAPREFPLVTATQRAGDEVVLGQPWQWGPPLTSAGSPSSRTVDEVILARGSTRRMDPAAGVPASTLTTAMEVSLRGIEVPHFVVVHAVDGMEPGLYRWPDLSSPLRTGSQRAEMFRISLEQGLTRDASFVVIGAADVTTLSPHAYREAQLAAGLVEGRLHLAAYALGAGATGMTFMDSEIPAYLGESVEALIFTCVGIPDYKPAVGGKPGTPTRVNQVRHRD